MFLLPFVSVDTLVAFVAGAVLAVVCPKVYAFVKKQVTSVEKDASPVVSSAEKIVSNAASAVANTVKSKL